MPLPNYLFSFRLQQYVTYTYFAIIISTMQIQELHQIEQYYEAVKNRDTNFIGSFFFGVKTTGIFCIPSCRARTPKPENLVYYTQVNELVAEGFRPCKLCKPTLNAYEMPPDIKQAIKMIHESPFEKIKDTHLVEHGIRPEKLRRWFKKNYGITFHAYQRMHRISNAYQNIKNGKKITDSAFNSGYESLSGFNHTFKTLLGKEPNKSNELCVIHIRRITTPLGPMLICASEKGICLLEFTDQKTLETELINLESKRQATILLGENQIIQQAEKELNEYFQGKRTVFNTPIDQSDTDFQINYWHHIQQIPFGETRCSSSLAKELQTNERYIQETNKMNKVAIILPCHRVICNPNKLHDNRKGLERKNVLIKLEKQNRESSIKNTK